MLPHQIQNLITQFTKLPGIGPRQAARFVFYLLRNPEEISELATNLKYLDEKVKLCANCFLPAEIIALLPPQAGGGQLLCRICANHHRDKNLICIVEKETDAVNLEKTRQFTGHYFVLGGFINPLEKESLAHQRLAVLKQKIQGECEVILALTPRREGDFTSLYIEEQLKSSLKQGLHIKITRLGRGLSSGAEVEYADEDTLRNALEGRK